MDGVYAHNARSNCESSRGMTLTGIKRLCLILDLDLNLNNNDNA